MTHIPTATLYTFVDDDSNQFIAMTGDTHALAEIGGGEESTMSVEGIVLLWDEEYTITDIQINPLQMLHHFDPAQYEGLGIGPAMYYSVLIRVMLSPRF
ncbi:MAG: hypothetical protein IT256_09300 [Chitinophagaceae bacterium]|nr:hypothetical protein [Chitinophagaceae bacterium]